MRIGGALIVLVGRKAKRLDPDDLCTPKYLARVQELFSHLHETGCERDRAHNRELFFDQYCSAVMFHGLCPVVTSMRALQEACQFPSVQQKLGVTRFSLGSFSEAPSVFEPRQLRPIAVRLAGRIQSTGVDRRAKEIGYAVHLVDRTLFAALPKVARSFYTTGRDGEGKHTWSLQVDLQLGMPAPDWIELKPGRPSERKGLKKHLARGRCYVQDRGYQDVDLLNRIYARGSRSVVRFREPVTHEVVSDHPISEEAKAAGVLSDQYVLLGTNVHNDHPVRLIVIKTEVHEKRTRNGKALSSGLMFLVSDLTVDEADSEVVALLYRYRWTIELFFRFFKQVLGMKHLISQRQKGIEILVYCMVIACMLLYLWLGAQMDLRNVRAVSLFILGAITREELVESVARRVAGRSAKTTV